VAKCTKQYACAVKRVCLCSETSVCGGSYGGLEVAKCTSLDACAVKRVYACGLDACTVKHVCACGLGVVLKWSKCTKRYACAVKRVCACGPVVVSKWPKCTKRYACGVKRMYVVLGCSWGDFERAKVHQTLCLCMFE
jgi:hypothetical protein